MGDGRPCLVPFCHLVTKSCQSLHSQSCPASWEHISHQSYELTKTSPLAIFPQLFHSKLQTVLQQILPRFIIISLPSFPSKLQTPWLTERSLPHADQEHLAHYPPTIWDLRPAFQRTRLYLATTTITTTKCHGQNSTDKMVRIESWINPAPTDNMIFVINPASI